MIGKIARSGDIPVGYYNDPVKDRRGVHHRGRDRRYVMPGDFATIEEDGSITLLGRGSVSYQFRAARRSSPRRSSRPCAPIPTCSTPSWWVHPTSVGDNGWPPSSNPGPTGTRHSATSRTTADEAIAGYKVPRQLHVVETIVRSPERKARLPMGRRDRGRGAPAESDSRRPSDGRFRPLSTDARPAVATGLIRKGVSSPVPVDRSVGGTGALRRADHGDPARRHR